jgi:alanine dehydrogenase
MRVLTEAETRTLVTTADAYRVVETAYRAYGEERTVLASPPGASMLIPHDPPTIVILKGAMLASQGIVGTRYAMQFGNYYCFVSDSRTNRLLGVVEESWLFRHRVGITAGIAAQWLARPAPARVALIGAGLLNTETCIALDHAYPAASFTVCARRPDSARAFAARLGKRISAPIAAAESAAEAVRDADIVVAITLAEAPMILPGMLKPGALMLSMGGVEEVTFACLDSFDRIIVDDPDYAFVRGDFAAWVAAGDIDRPSLEARIDADIGEIAAGLKPGRTGDGQTILAVIQGMACCDIALAKHAIDAANSRDIGTWVASIAESPGHTPPENRRLVHTPYPTLVIDD